MQTCSSGSPLQEADKFEKVVRQCRLLSDLRRQGLYPCEAEIARRLSQSEQRWRSLARQLESEGLPRPDPLIKRRYWPAVKAFFDARAGLGNDAAAEPEDGKEHWE